MGFKKSWRGPEWTSPSAKGRAAIKWEREKRAAKLGFDLNHAAGRCEGVCNTPGQKESGGCSERSGESEGLFALVNALSTEAGHKGI